MSDKIRLIGAFLMISLTLCLAGCLGKSSDQGPDRLSDLLSTTYADIPETFGEIRHEYSEDGGSPVCSLGNLPGVLVVYSGAEFPPSDERLPDELVLTGDYDGQISGISVGDDLSEIRDITFVDAWFSLNTGMAGLVHESDDLTLTLSVICEPGTTPTEESTSDEWETWREEFLADPAGRIETMRLRKTGHTLPALAVSIEKLSDMMERSETNESFPAEKYNIHVLGMQTPVTLTMLADLVSAVSAYDQNIELTSPVDIYGNCDFELFRADRAVIIEGGGNYFVQSDIYVISPGKHTMIAPGDTESYFLMQDDDGKLRYRLTTNHYADIIQTGALSVATGYDYFLYADGGAAIVNGEIVFSGPDESFTVSDKYDLEREFEEMWADRYNSLEERFTANRVDSEPAPKSVIRTIDKLPEASDEAIMSASPVGMNPSYFLFETDMTFYQYDRYTDSYHVCTLTLPEGFTDGSIIRMTRGGGSEETDMIVKAKHGDAAAYLDYCFYSGDSSGGLDPLYVRYLDRIGLDTSGIPQTLPTNDKTDTVTERTGAVSDYSSVNTLLSCSTWYSYYNDGDNKMLQTLDFDSSCEKMSWKIGWFESEYKNTFSGPLGIDENHVFHAKLYDALRDEGTEISFTINIINDSLGSGELDLTFMSLDPDEYKALEGTTLHFSQDASPGYTD